MSTQEITHAVQETGKWIVPLQEDPVSATAIRERVRSGKPIDGLVPDPVRDYILSHGLYRATHLKESTK